MFALFDFGFQIFKIAIQAALYAGILLILKSLITKIKRHKILNSIKFKQVYFCTSIALFAFSFSYYGNHGLGDEANIPLGNWRTMNSSDGYAYFYLNPQSQISVDSFFVRKGYLCFASKDSYYSYQLASGKWNKFNTQTDYESYAAMKGLPRVNEFKTFYSQYDAYWNGWRFWLLP